MDCGELLKTSAALYQHKRNSRLSGLSPSKTTGLHKTLAKGVLLNKFYY